MTTIAPALMKGLRGMPCSASSWTMELKADAGGLAADAGPQALAEPPEREGQEEDLGDALDREGLGRVPRRMDGAVEGHDREAEALRIDVGELRDVVGDRAGAEARGERGVDLLHDLLEVG